MDSRNAVVLNGALGLPSLHGVVLQRSPATIRLLATEMFFDDVRMLGHWTPSEHEDRHSLGFLVHAESKKRV
jgi:hypothetical protein